MYLVSLDELLNLFDYKYYPCYKQKHNHATDCDNDFIEQNGKHPIAKFMELKPVQPIKPDESN